MLKAEALECLLDNIYIKGDETCSKLKFSNGYQFFKSPLLFYRTKKSTQKK